LIRERDDLARGKKELLRERDEFTKEKDALI
jgi:hypothetical protein